MSLSELNQFFFLCQNANKKNYNYLTGGCVVIVTLLLTPTRRKSHKQPKMTNEQQKHTRTPTET